MATGYTVFLRDGHSSDGSGVRQIQVFWREADAVELVERLNALAPEASRGRYFWQPAWIARRTPGQPVSLTPHDRENLDLARRHGFFDTEQSIEVFFSFIFNFPGAQAAVADLRSLGWPDPGLDEESEGDGCWHVYAHEWRLVLNDESIASLRSQMEDLAEKHGGTFNDWDLSHGRGLRLTKPGELLG